ncbi:hypothetical protein ONS95_011434 [Cadophora gregata]|nr:uncharacterized protein ONS95_011434 [Cadophora gregata]KAK0120017.1 hypothetical protein ONS95_011434 [Cadophora gregata]KAK0121052.1 hypothetical protein ONS96_011236 [Cadophora gregata f. sp. sojae]
MHQGSNSHPLPKPIRPPSYSTPYASIGSTTAANGVSQRPSVPGFGTQGSSSQPGTDHAPRPLLSPSPEPVSLKLDNRSTTSASESQKASYSSIYGFQIPPEIQVSRFGYPERPSQPSRQIHGGKSSIGQGRARTDLPPPAKAPFRASANIAHPSHYQQSTLQFSSTPKVAASPRSSFQVVLPTSPATFYGTSPYSAANSRPYPSGAPSSAARRGRPLKGAEAKPADTVPKKRGRPVGNKPRVEPTPKKRGRPFKTVESELKAKARASSSGTSTPTYKKKGRPFKVRHQPFIPQPEPIFYPFICEWKGCQAELHNLETLRLHIHIVHKKKEFGKVTCLWAKCGAKKVIEGADGEKTVLDDHPAFATRQEWKEHLEVKHLIPFAWHMGDGPKATDLSGKPKGIINPLWLNDSNGNQVTPSVKGQLLEEGRASILNKKRFRKMKGMNIFKEKQVAGGQDLKGMGGMAPPAISSDDEDEDTGIDEAELELETEGLVNEEGEEDEDDEEEMVRSEALHDRRAGGSQVVRLVDEHDDSDGDDMHEEDDVQMMGL